MVKSYVYTLVQSLTDAEVEHCHNFIRSPFITKQFRDADSVSNLLQRLSSVDIPEKAVLNQQLFPEEGHKTAKLDKLMNELAGGIRQFLLWQKYMKPTHQFEQKLDWVETIRERGLIKRYQQELKSLVKYVDRNARESTLWYYRKFQLAYEIHETESIRNNAKGDLHIPEVIDRLHAYFYVQRLELLNLLFLQKKVTSLEIPDHTHTTTEGLIPAPIKANYPILLIAEAIHQQLISPLPKPEAFNTIMDLLKQHELSLESSVLQHFYAYLRNICILLIEDGHTAFTETLHQIQKNNLEKGYLFYQGKLSPSAYMSVTRIAIQIGQYDWALQFINDYKDKVMDSGDEVENLYYLNKALCWFAKGLYEKALQIIPPHFADVTYLIYSKRLELKIYFELNADLLIYRMDAYKMYLSRASKKYLPASVKEPEKNFVNILLQIVQSPLRDKERFKTIRDRIREKKHIADRDWLMEIVERRI
ncbi:MAG: hypothetical protein AAFZ63_15735 [Bacteroidota bacterium]